MAVWVAEKRLDCRKCSEREKKNHGFDEDTAIPWEWEGEYLYRCPQTLVTNQSYEYINAYVLLESGYGWPDAAGWQYNPAKLIEAIRIIQAEFVRIEEEKSREQQNT